MEAHRSLVSHPRMSSVVKKGRYSMQLLGIGFGFAKKFPEG